MPGRERSVSMIPTKTHKLSRLGLATVAAARAGRQARAARAGGGRAAGDCRAGRLSAA
jgi:hypothetical protein